MAQFHINLLFQLDLFLRPNNGGKKCIGSNLRGLICGGLKSGCKAMTLLEYGTKLCTAIKNDQEKPDRQLTGATFLRMFSKDLNCIKPFFISVSNVALCESKFFQFNRNVAFSEFSFKTNLIYLKTYFISLFCAHAVFARFYSTELLRAL